MGYDDMAPIPDKWLHSDGSVTTMAGEVILPADPGRAEDYASRSPQAAKWLLPDGIIVDSMPGGGGSSGELPKPYYRASCDTPGATVVKDLTGLPDGYVPATGDILLIQFNGSANVARNIKFSIAGGTAQYAVLFNGLVTSTDASAWKPGGIFPFYFDGMNFHQLSYSKEYDNNTTYTGFFEQTAYGFMLKVSPDRALKKYQLAIERPDCSFEKVVTSGGSANNTKPANTSCE